MDLKDILERKARAWAFIHPDLRSRCMKAPSLVSKVSYIGEGTYEVLGSKGQAYFVGFDRRRRTSTCTCIDSQRGHHCKHRIAVALLWIVGEV
jgi:hypothetical protein